MFEVVGAARFAADAAQFEAAEGLAADEGSGDRPVEIEVADDELLADSLQIRGAAAVAAAGQGVVGAVGNRQRFGEVSRPERDEDRTEDFLLSQLRVGSQIDEDVWADEVALGGQVRIDAAQDQTTALRFAQFDVLENSRGRILVDDGADVGRRIFGGTDLQ